MQIGGGEYSTSKSGSDIIVTVGDGKITLVGATNLKTLNIAGTKKSTVPATLLTVTNSTKSPVTVGSSIKTIDASKRTKAVKITGNSSANSIIGGSKNDSLYGGKGNDTLSGGKGNDLLTGGKGKDVFIYTAGKDIISDYTVGDDKIKIASGTISTATLSGKNVVFTIGSGSLTVKNAKGKKISMLDSAGKSFTTTINAATQFVTDSTKSPVTVGSSIKNVDASKRTKAVKITGNSSANYIVGGSKNDSLYGGKGADTLSGGKGNDLLSGGKGKDVFVYTAGKDTITDYASGEDKIKIASGIISKATLSGKNVVFTIGSGSLTVKNAKGKKLSMIDSSGKSFTTTINATTQFVTDSTKSPVTVGSSIKNIDASKRTKAVKITGNSSANSIVGGSKNDSLYGGNGSDTLRGGKGVDKLYGGKGDDTLYGGAGNDSLWGNAGSDKFIYSSGDGKDVIYGFEKNDLLQITGTFSAPTYDKSKKEISFKVGSGSVTLRDFGSTTTFNVNKYTYQLSGNMLIKR